jgi:radical SAM protein with 4Fe4S-binding SPASM domain
MNNRMHSFLKYYLLKNPRKGMNLFRSKANTFLIKLARNSLLSPNPDTFIFKLTDRCNLRCIQCGQWGERGVYLAEAGNPCRTELSEQDWIEFTEKNHTRIFHIYFWGGEPFLREDLLRIVQFASKKGITSEITTNGTYLYDYADKILDSGVDSLYISLDGPEEIHNKIRKGSGNVFKKIVSGIERIIYLKREKHLSLPLLQVIMTLTLENQKNIIDTYEIARQMGVDVFSFQLGLFTTNELEKISSSRFQKEFGCNPRFWKGFIRNMSGMDIEAVSEQINYIKNDSILHRKIAYHQTPNFEFDLQEYFFKPENQLTNRKCLIPWRYLEIRPDGDIALCIDFPELIAGNIMHQNWKDIWNNEVNRKFRETISQNGIFPSCSRCCAYLDSCSSSRLRSFLQSYISRKKSNLRI